MQRRNFLQTCSTALAVAIPVVRYPSRISTERIASPRLARTDPESLTTLRDPRVRALALDAVDAARAAGARYADVRLANTIYRNLNGSNSVQSVNLDLGVRALVNGYWGFASTPLITVDHQEAIRVARESTRMATEAATHGRLRTVELGTIPVVPNGTWETPVVVDPLTLEDNEINDWLHGMAGYIRDLGRSRGDPQVSVNPGLGSNGIGIAFGLQERVFASTEGSFLQQTVTTVTPGLNFTYHGITSGQIPGYNLTLQGGWELLARRTDEQFRDLIRKTMDDMDAIVRRTAALKMRPIEFGRYDMVLTANAMASIIGLTLGKATEIDRALGYEANATGTSYLGPDPMRYLGTQVASPLVTLTAERSTPTAAATVKWDEEGVAPEDFTIVKNGVLVDYQTTREQATWLAPWYEKHGGSVRSRGCAGAPSAGFVAMQHTPNLHLLPGPGNLGLDDMVASLDHGLVVYGIGLQTDMQCLNGIGAIAAVEVKQGRQVALASNSVALRFRSPEFWKSIITLGGKTSADWSDGPGFGKGAPFQTTPYSVSAVPALVKQQAVIDLMRKA